VRGNINANTTTQLNSTQLNSTQLNSTQLKQLNSTTSQVSNNLIKTAPKQGRLLKNSPNKLSQQVQQGPECLE
jgi:hypothetical protein